MSYQVIARKWRPQSFEEVVGQEIVTKTLQNAIRSGRIAHAFLFSGVRGVGKTTLARILAKALNCREGPTPQPCLDCVSCQEIRDVNSVDVQEIDAASNRGIDSIRELRESVRYGTARDRFKIFIVDEVHMLTNEAFNALLKTLEEPPEHVKFILATTQHHKIPVTITSRCQQYEFHPIPFPLILERLTRITDAEKIEISEEGIRSVAAVAEGSMRDAQSTLDQILAFCGRTVRDEDVRALLGVVDIQLVIGLVQRIVELDRKGLVVGLEELRSNGISPQNFCRRFIEYIRALLVCKVVGWETSMLQLPDSLRTSVEQQAEAFSELDLIRFYDTLNRTGNDLRWHSHPHLHLEISLLKLVELARLPAIEEVVSRLETTSNLISDRHTAEELGRIEPKKTEDRSLWDTSSSETPLIEPLAKEGQAAGPENDLVSRFMATLQVKSMGLYQHLRLASEISIGQGRLTIRFPEEERFHALQVELSENQKRLAEIASRVTGSEVSIQVVLEESVEVQQSASDPTADPKVKSFLERFPGKVIVKRD
jgi:DNA polymerase-3 subunit gamma/tau